MNAVFEEYLKTLDEKFLGIGHKDNFKAISAEFSKKIHDLDDADAKKYLKLEIEIFDIWKSVENGLQPSMREPKQQQDGKTVEYIYPDFNAYGVDEYTYIEKRYTKTTNIFLKTEYGLMLYNNNQLKRNDQKLELVKQLIQLGTDYNDLIFANQVKWSLYSQSLYTRLIDALVILCRAGASLKDELDKFIKLLQTWFVSTPVTHPAYMSFCNFISRIFKDQYKKISEFIDVTAVFKKFDEGIAHYESTNLRDAIYIAEAALKLKLVVSNNASNLYQDKLGVLNEREGDNISSQHPFGATKCYEDAISYFHDAKNTAAIKRVSKKFEENKGKGHMGTIPYESDEEESNMLTKIVKDVIERASVSEIIARIAGYGFYLSADQIEESAVKLSQQALSVNLFTVSIPDKYGNTLKVFNTPEKKLLYQRLMVVDQNYIYLSQLIHKILIRAMYEKIISYNDIKDVLEKSWLNEPVEWMSGGKTMSAIPLKSILPGIQHFFDEIQKRIDDETHIPNMVLSTDSLATKFEMILRYMCKKIGIPTFRYIQEGEHLLTDEKTLGDLIKELEMHLNPTDIILLRYILNEKGGPNIRNSVAHGLLDSQEYGPFKPLTLIGFIIRLSQYQITTQATNE